jgi:hypothetical protein
MGARGGVNPSGLSSRTAPSSWLRWAQPCKGPGTLWGLTPLTLLAFFRRAHSFLAGLLQRPGACSLAAAPVLPGPTPFQQEHALAAFEQGDWLAELDLLQLGQALKRHALARGSYDGRAFDLMVCIAEVLEADHGWSIEQSEAWLVRMGLWEEEF